MVECFPGTLLQIQERASFDFIVVLGFRIHQKVNRGEEGIEWGFGLACWHGTTPFRGIISPILTWLMIQDVGTATWRRKLSGGGFLETWRRKLLYPGLRQMILVTQTMVYCIILHFILCFSLHYFWFLISCSIIKRSSYKNRYILACETKMKFMFRLIFIVVVIFDSNIFVQNNSNLAQWVES